MWVDATKEGDGAEMNLRMVFLQFKTGSESGHREAMMELAECYRAGRGCDRDIMEAIELRSAKTVLEFGKEKEKRGDEKECVRFFWMAFGGGEEEKDGREAGGCSRR